MGLEVPEDISIKSSEKILGNSEGTQELIKDVENGTEIEEGTETSEDDIIADEEKSFRGFAADLVGNLEITGMDELDEEVSAAVLEFREGSVVESGEEEVEGDLEDAVEEEIQPQEQEKQEQPTIEESFEEDVEFDVEDVGILLGDEIDLDQTQQVYEYLAEPMSQLEKELADVLFAESGEKGQNWEAIQAVLEKKKADGEIQEILFGDEDEEEKTNENLKLLLRIAVKLGTKAAIILAKNLAKETNDEAARFLLNSFADITAEAGKGVDKVLSNKGENLSTSLRSRLNGKE